MDDTDRQPALTLDRGRPAIVGVDGRVRRTTAPQLFDTGGGSYLGYARDWDKRLAELYPSTADLEAAEQAAIEEYGLADRAGEIPSIFLMVAMTLED